VLGLAASLRGRPLSGHLDRPIPSWIDPAFARQAGLAERGRARTASERRESRSSIEARWYLTHPLFAKVFGALGEIALEEGVESRSPLLDQDIIALAASRPPEERSSGRETKRLLRLSMKGLLPESIIAPRSKKTGTTDGFFAKTMYAESPRWLEPLIDEPLLGQMGIVSVDAVRRACDRYRRTGAIDIGIGLYFTLQTELWLRTRAGTRESAVAEAQSAGFPAQVGATS
jgi:asparagine synthetase B (glutamine-hydrolysing)